MRHLDRAQPLLLVLESLLMRLYRSICLLGERVELFLVLLDFEEDFLDLLTVTGLLVKHVLGQRHQLFNLDLEVEHALDVLTKLLAVVSLKQLQLLHSLVQRLQHLPLDIAHLVAVKRKFCDLIVCALFNE